MSDIQVVADAATAFRAAMAEAGLTTAAAIVADGRLRRFHVEGDRRRTLNGWYILHADPPASGAFGCWKRGIGGSWSATAHERLSFAERAEIRRRADEARVARLLEEQCRREDAAERAARIWARSVPASVDHPYITRKRITPGNARQSGERLVLPVVDLDNLLWSLQFIDPAGGKMLLSGGRKRGHVIPASEPLPGGSRVLLCEGWATGRTLAAMDPAALVLAAVDAGNLEPAAVSVRRRWPDAEIVVCCDADDVGVTKGRAAAVAAGALVAIPEFPAGAVGSDFNDLANILRGVGR